MPGLLTKAELDQMLARAETAQEVTLPIDKFRDLVLQASVSEIAPSTGQSERELFDAWLAATYDSDAEFDEARNCYKEFAVHMAWQAFRGARSLPSSIEADAHAELDKAEISRRHSRDSGATWIEYSLAERIHILAGGYAIAEREREEAQGAVSAIVPSAEMFRCLGFAFEKKTVEHWPVWCCSMDTVKEAVKQGWMDDSERASIHPRLGLTAVVYKLTDKGGEQFCRLAYEHAGALGSSDDTAK